MQVSWQEAKARASLLGTARVMTRGGTQVVLPEKAYLLLAFLALACPGHCAPRSQAAQVLWPDVPPPQASANLRQLLGRIRKRQDLAGVELITVTSTEVRLRTADVWVDVLALENRVAEISWENLGEILELLGNGPMLPGWSTDEVVRDPTAWRERPFRHLIAAVDTLLERDDLDAHAALARDAAECILFLEPFHEPACRALMRAHAAEGNIYDVKRVMEHCRRELARELGVKPDAETEETYRRLLRGADISDPASPQPRTLARPSRAGDVGQAASIAAGVPKIAILMPFRGQASDELYGIAISLLDDVNMGLCSLRTISVVAPFSAGQIGFDPERVQEFVERYDVTYLVESNLHVLHGSNTLSLRLIDARSRSMLWAQRVPLGKLQLAASYREICVGLVPSIADALERAELRHAETAEEQTAYYWFLRGQRYLRRIDLPNVRKARQAFRRAIASRAEFAPAYSGAARTLQIEWILLARGEHVGLATSEKLARRAIELDPRDSGGYHQLAFASLYNHRFDESIAHFTQAERRHPQHADLLADFADCLAHSGRPEAGLKKLEQAIVLNPIVPDGYWWSAAGMNYQLHRYEEAVNCALRMKDGAPAWRLVAASYAQLGDFASARVYVEKTLETYPDFRVEHWLSIVPNRNPDDIRHYKAGLRAAGFP